MSEINLDEWLKGLQLNVAYPPIAAIKELLAIKELSRNENYGLTSNG